MDDDKAKAFNEEMGRLAGENYHLRKQLAAMTRTTIRLIKELAIARKKLADAGIQEDPLEKAVDDALSPASGTDSRDEREPLGDGPSLATWDSRNHQEHQW